MADALVSIVLEKLGSIVLDGIEEEVKLIVGVKNEIKSLTDTLTIIQGVLQDADDKQVKNKAVKFWLEEFKDISYDAEDILDDWSTRSLIGNVQHLDLNDSAIKKVRSNLFSLFSCFKPIVIRHDIGNKIKDLNERLVGVVEKIQTYGLREIRSNEQHRPITSDLVVAEEIYGRDVDKDLILTKLLDESVHYDSHVPVISIVGTGGFGKTTLAQLILKQTKQLTKFNFDMHMWVCVSDPFNLEKVAKEIIEQAKGEVPVTVGWPMLHKSLYESVRGKCFILVLDDVWSHNSNDWRQLKQALDGGAKGSRILITTRDERVANMMDSNHTHLLGQMSDHDCWSLFERIAFSRREDDRRKFEDIGQAISKKCNGVPLAARVIASLVRCKKTKKEWRAILESNFWEVQEGDEGFLPSILLSYYSLPSYLKACLMYCAVLPKDSKISKEEMVKLWMAQGYLGSNASGSSDLEMIGRDYFDNLAMLSFFQDFEKDDEGNITGCKMHDLVHDFVQFLTKNETVILEEEKVSSVKVRHLCAGDLGWSSIYQQKNLRTLRIHSKKDNILARELLHQLACLRALSLCDCGIQELPSEVERLLHLRYLDLSNNYKLEELPETVCNLLNLQTLDLSGCQSLIRLPEAIAKLSSSLRHLRIEGCSELKYTPVGVGKLRWLRTLEEFIVGGFDNESKEKGCTIGELRLLNHLEGCLKITGLGKVALDASNVAQAELKMKEKLQSLELVFTREDKDGQIMMDGIFESLQPHTNLEKLKIRYFTGFRLPDWILSLFNLTELTLRNLDQCLQLPALGKLASLEVLFLDGLQLMKRFGSEFYGVDETHDIHNRSSLEQVVIFPKLKKLKLSNMSGLEEWDLPLQNRVDLFPKLQEVVFRKEKEEKRCNTNNGIIIMPSLSKLVIHLCPMLKVIPLDMFSHTLEDLEISLCSKLTRLQLSLPPLLKRLHLAGNVGVLTSTLPLLHNYNYPNLHYFEISESSQSSLPQGFNQLTSIRELTFIFCNLNFGPDDLKHLTMLEKLSILYSPVLAERFIRGGEISNFSSHVYNIVISPKPIVHAGIRCDNCEMNPLVGKRYQCKDCYCEGVFYTSGGRGFDLCEKCYYSPHKHTDLVNQHNRKDHTFELIANHGDSPAPIDKSAEIYEENSLASFMLKIFPGGI